jgi:hypothetical protein
MHGLLKAATGIELCHGTQRLFGGEPTGPFGDELVLIRMRERGDVEFRGDRLTLPIGAGRDH